jgi:hypothetical protein
MSFRTIALSLATLALLGAGAGSGQTVPPKQPRPGTVAKLIAQLGADDFRSREEASARLEKLGGPVLPELRKAAKSNPELEVKHRIERVVVRIEKALLEAEEKQWQGLDAPRRGIKDRVVKVLAKPALSDHQVASAVYLLTVARPPTAPEAARARKQLTASNSRLVGALRLARSLVQGKGASAEVASANGRLFKVQKDLAAEGDLAKKLHRLNGAEFQKITDAVAAALEKAVKTDDQLVDLAYLLALSRFPRATEPAAAVAHLKKSKERSRAASDLIWALMNSRELLLAP